MYLYDILFTNSDTVDNYELPSIELFERFHQFVRGDKSAPHGFVFKQETGLTTAFNFHHIIWMSIHGYEEQIGRQVKSP